MSQPAHPAAPERKGAEDARAQNGAAFETMTRDQIRWREIPGGLGAEAATLFGSQNSPGLYVVRVRFPPHTMDTPHSHTADRHVTVLEGNWVIGTGPEFDPEKVASLAPGTVMFHPAGAVHWDGSAGDEPVIVQIVGMGPVTTVPVETDGPRWVRVGQPA